LRTSLKEGIGAGKEAQRQGDFDENSIDLSELAPTSALVAPVPLGGLNHG